MNEEELFAADQEDRYFYRLNRRARNNEEDDDLDGGNPSKEPFSPNYFNAIWEGRGD